MVSRPRIVLCFFSISAAIAACEGASPPASHEQEAATEHESTPEPDAELEPARESDADGEEDPNTEQDAPCADGAQRSCYTGPPETRGLGFCHDGLQTCWSGTWGRCDGEATPLSWTCPGYADLDCDGEIDPEPPCVSGRTRACSPGGDLACPNGLQTCTFEGVWGLCAGESPITEEVCDGLDNDCDGTVDEGCSCMSGDTRGCGVHDDPCMYGMQICCEGGWTPCMLYRAPLPEVCDGEDNDCDGLVDEPPCAVCTPGDTVICGTNEGACTAGIHTCEPDGRWGACMGAIWPRPETCDGEDKDCDGITDNVAPEDSELCEQQLGMCAGSRKRCLDGAWQPCTGADHEEDCGDHEAEELLCDGRDNDCDGMVDPNPPCGCDPFVEPRECYDGSPEWIGVGTCRAGIQLCVEVHGSTAGYSYGQCLDQVLPGIELCDDLDNDCDDVVDNGYPQKGLLCVRGEGECRSEGEFVCRTDGEGVICSAVDLCAVPEPDAESEPDADAEEAPEPEAARDAPCGTTCPTIQWVSLPGGTFDLGREHRVTLTAFRIARHEVTVAQYRSCVEQGACTPIDDDHPYCNWNDPSRSQHPLNCVTWYQAVTFAEWVGARLPSESEWEFAARSGGRDRDHPWGAEPPTCEHAVRGRCCHDRTLRVCSLPAGSSVQGACDFIGNVWEWTADAWHQDLERTPADGRPWLDDCLMTRSANVIRGGGWIGEASALTRNAAYLQQRSWAVGFRLARSD